MIGMAAIILIILLSGYLLIYNVLSLSVSKDIRYYGLLKTIGTTPVQLGRIVIAQALRLAFIGIPIGLLLGAVISYIVVPLELSVSDLKTGAVISYNPLIFIGAAVFTILTTLIASLKPAGKVRRISPVEAIRYTGLTVKRNVSKSSRGGKIQRMAVKNIFRDRKKALLVLASLFLGMTTFLVINTLVLSMNVDNLVADYIKTDFKLTNNSFKVNASEIKQVFDKTFISKLNNIKGVKNIREISSQDVSVEFSDKFYGQYLQYLYQKYKIPVLTEGMVSKNPDIFWACLVGLDTDYIRELNKNMEKPIDIEAFESGKIALYNIDKPELFQLGSNIAFTDRENRCKYAIKLGGFLSDDDSYNGVGGLAPNIYISNNRMRQLYKDPAVYAITLDAEEGYKEKVLLQLEELLGSSSEISLDSKQQMLEKFSKDKLIMFILGGGMALILAFIGIMNFINIMVTSVNARRQEFAVMESIGMSSLQLNRMLLFEGGAYAAITCTLVLTFGNCISYILFKLFQTEATYAVYTFPFVTLFISFVVIFAVCLMVPGITYNSISRQSITERLRSIEG
jgi:putative ABC transport system permease protein